MAPDREKVIEGLREMSCRCTWKDIDRIRDKFQPVVNGAFDLLKENEPVKPSEHHRYVLAYKCTYCCRDVLEEYRFCPFCGRRLDWDGA